MSMSKPPHQSFPEALGPWRGTRARARRASTTKPQPGGENQLIWGGGLGFPNLWFSCGLPFYNKDRKGSS